MLIIYGPVVYPEAGNSGTLAVAVGPGTKEQGAMSVNFGNNCLQRRQGSLVLALERRYLPSHFNSKSQLIPLRSRTLRSKGTNNFVELDSPSGPSCPYLTSSTTGLHLLELDFINLKCKRTATINYVAVCVGRNSHWQHQDAVLGKLVR